MSEISYDNCPTSAPFFGFMGVTAALVFANIGAGKLQSHDFLTILWKTDYLLSYSPLVGHISGTSIWDGKKWSWHCIDGGYEAKSRDAKYYSGKLLHVRPF